MMSEFSYPMTQMSMQSVLERRNLGDSPPATDNYSSFPGGEKNQLDHCQRQEF